jgi:hypothetical protein
MYSDADVYHDDSGTGDDAPIFHIAETAQLAVNVTEEQAGGMMGSSRLPSPPDGYTADDEDEEEEEEEYDDDDDDDEQEQEECEDTMLVQEAETVTAPLRQQTASVPMWVPQKSSGATRAVAASPVKPESPAKTYNLRDAADLRNFRRELESTEEQDEDTGSASTTRVTR